MPEITITDEQNVFNGLYPSVFKKVDNTDIQINSFQAYKSWTVTSGSATSSLLPLQGIYNNLELPALETDLTFNDAKNIDDSLQTVIYYSIDHLFYKRKTQPANTFGPTDLNRTHKFLYETASVFTFPQKKIGEGIKPASFTLSVPGTASFNSDVYGNVRDTNFNTGSIISDVRLYEGFNEYFDESRIEYQSNNVTYIDGVPTTTGDTLPVGLAANFTSSSFIKSNIDGEYNRDRDYAISFFISGANSTTDNQLVLAKASSSLSLQYPFRVELSGSNEIVYKVSGASISTQLTSSISVDTWSHVLCQKTGSNIELYIDGTFHASASNPGLLSSDFISVTASEARIDNNSPLCIGGFSSSSMNLTGELDELRIYNKALTSTEIGYLADRTEGGTFIQTDVVGNVFAKQGIVNISTVDYRYQDIINYAYTASYQSTKTIHELGVTVRIDQGDFNMSNNVTLTTDNNVTYRNFVSGSDFSPYITSIGLYDTYGRLLAIGKLAQPIKKRIDVDMNFLVRIDLDKNVIK
jgi:hypothetical protein